MKTSHIGALLTLVLALSMTVLAQDTTMNPSSTSPTKTTEAKKKRGPIFKATKDQIKQAQAILKQRGFYSGEETGELDAATRAGLKKYQETESLKVTGTLNRITLEKMEVSLTEKQKAM